MKKILIKLVWSAALSTATVGAAFGAAPEVIPGKYIVMLKRGADAAKVAGAHGVTLEATYTDAINGFAGEVPAGRLEALKKHADVISVEPDIIVSIADKREAIVASGSSDSAIATGELL